VERVNNPARQRGIDSLQLHQRLAKAEAERDLLLDQVADLRAQRERDAEERRALTARLLTYQPGRPPWWRRWFRGY
jgi:hypothetical protein